MTGQSPAIQLEAKAKREQARLLKARDELHLVASTITHSELPPEVKLRLMGALRAENELLTADAERIAGLRRAAELSRSKQWVNQSKDGT